MRAVAACAAKVGCWAPVAPCNGSFGRQCCCSVDSTEHKHRWTANLELKTLRHLLRAEHRQSPPTVCHRHPTVTPGISILQSAGDCVCCWGWNIRCPDESSCLQLGRIPMRMFGFSVNTWCRQVYTPCCCAGYRARPGITSRMCLENVHGCDLAWWHRLTL
jgi:hypothetical protein